MVEQLAAVTSTESSSLVEQSTAVASAKGLTEKVEMQETKVYSSSEATDKAVSETSEVMKQKVEKTKDLTKAAETTGPGDVEKPKGQAPEIIGTLTDMVCMF